MHLDHPTLLVRPSLQDSMPGGLQEKVDTWRTSTRSRGVGATLHKPRVLVLGSGMVAGPCVDDLAGPGDLDVVVGM